MHRDQLRLKVGDTKLNHCPPRREAELPDAHMHVLESDIRTFPDAETVLAHDQHEAAYLVVHESRRLIRVIEGREQRHVFRRLWRPVPPSDE